MNAGLLCGFFANSPCAFALIGPDLEILECNAGFAQFLRSSGQVSETPLRQLGPGLLRAACEAALSEGKTARALVLENSENWADRSPWRAEVFPVHHEKHPVAGVILREESGEKDLKTLAEQVRQNQELMREMDAFSYSISHDLKAPLRAVMGFSQALHFEAGSALEGRAAEYLERVRKSAERMNEMMDQLLKFSRAVRHEPVCSKVDISALAGVVACQAAETTPENHKVQWQIQPGLVALTDEKYLRSVLEILLSNALKFTRDQPEPRVEIGVVKLDGQKHFFVRDNGVGYDPAYAEKLFSPFQRLHAPEDFPGEGMGLAMARKILRRLGGRIRAESQLDQGATFFFTVGEEQSQDSRRHGTF